MGAFMIYIIYSEVIIDLYCYCLKTSYKALVKEIQIFVLDFLNTKLSLKNSGSQIKLFSLSQVDLHYICLEAPNVTFVGLT